MEPKIGYSEEKNLLLKETRGISFEEVIEAIGKGGILANLRHKDRQRYSHQRILAVKIKNYVYAVLYVFNRKKETIFLKTVYPSRALTKKYLTRKK